MSKQLKVWYSVLVAFDEVGNATIEKSYMVPAKDSDIKKKRYSKGIKGSNIEHKGEETVW